MQRIQASRLLMGLWVGCALAGCGQEKPAAPPVPTVADYLHDIDKARAVLKKAAGVNTGPEVVNASAASAQLANSSILACWPVKPSNTANTDHDCLDRAGFVRSK